MSDTSTSNNPLLTYEDVIYHPDFNNLVAWIAIKLKFNLIPIDELINEVKINTFTTMRGKAGIRNALSTIVVQQTKWVMWELQRQKNGKRYKGGQLVKYPQPNFVSIDEDKGSSQNLQLKNIITDHKQDHQNKDVINKDLVKNLMKCLCDVDKMIVKDHIAGRTLEEIGKSCNLSRQRVKQRYDSALVRMNVFYRRKKENKRNLYNED